MLPLQFHLYCLLLRTDGYDPDCLVPVDVFRFVRQSTLLSSFFFSLLFLSFLSTIVDSSEGVCRSP